MHDLIKALVIFTKYTPVRHVTGCEHDVFYVYVSPAVVTDKDKEELARYGFEENEHNDCFESYVWGSA